MDKTRPSTKLKKKIYQANPIIQARKNMNAIELRLFAIGLAGLNPHLSSNDRYYDAEFKETFVTTKELTKLFGNTSYLHELETVCRQLFNRTMELKRPDGGFEFYHIFQKIKYVPSEGLYIKFDDMLKPFLLDLLSIGGWTGITMSHLFKLSSPYAWRLMELMLQFRGTKRQIIVRTISIEDLRFTLNVSEEAYKGKMCNFRRNVLDGPIEEINRKTDYRMRYRVLKSGKRVSGFELKMALIQVGQEEIQEELQDYKSYGETILQLQEFGIKETAAEKLIDICGSEDECIKRLKYAITELKRQSDSGIIKNKAGFIYKAIEENWLNKSIADNTIKLEAKWWKKLLKKLKVGSIEKAKELTGIKRMLRAEEIKKIRADLLKGSLSSSIKIMLKRLGWEEGLAIDIFSINSKH